MEIDRSKCKGSIMVYRKKVKAIVREQHSSIQCHHQTDLDLRIRALATG